MIILEGVIETIVKAFWWLISSPLPLILIIFGGFSLSMAASRYKGVTNWPAWVLGIILMIAAWLVIMIKF